mgnify:FL=1
MNFIKFNLIIFIFIIINNIAYASKINHKPYLRMLIIESANKYKYVSPSLALAVAKVESNFNSKAISPKGAIGVMQIMPKTALLEFGVTRKKLFNPKINIDLGIKFLNHLIKKYNGRIDIALSHYNGGSAVGKWPNVKVIPATYTYVLKVLKESSKFKNINFHKKRLYAYKSGRIKDYKATNELDMNLNNIDKWLDVYKNYKNSMNFNTNIDKISKIIRKQSNKSNSLAYMGSGTTNRTFY